MFFYEIYEAEDELALGVTLAHDERISPEDFLAAVEEARGRIIESYTEETLVEAIAVELERSHGFYPALDRRLVAAVRASVEEEHDPDLRDTEDLLAGREPRALRSAVVELERAEDESN
jgi:hypothetical protein